MKRWWQVLLFAPVTYTPSAAAQETPDAPLPAPDVKAPAPGGPDVQTPPPTEAEKIAEVKRSVAEVANDLRLNTDPQDFLALRERTYEALDAALAIQAACKDPCSPQVDRAVRLARSEVRQLYVRNHFFVGAMIPVTTVRLKGTDDPATLEYNEKEDLVWGTLDQGAGVALSWMPCQPHHVCLGSFSVPVVAGFAEGAGGHVASGLMVGLFNNSASLGVLADLFRSENGRSSGALHKWMTKGDSWSAANVAFALAFNLNAKNVEQGVIARSDARD